MGHVLTGPTNEGRGELISTFRQRGGFVRRYYSSMVTVTQRSCSVLGRLCSVPRSGLTCIPGKLESRCEGQGTSRYHEMERGCKFGRGRGLLVFTKQLSFMGKMVRLVRTFGRMLVRVPSAGLVVTKAKGFARYLSITGPY